MQNPAAGRPAAQPREGEGERERGRGRGRGRESSKAAADTAWKRACICAPTNHAGSFRCHLHQAKIMSCNTAHERGEWPELQFQDLIIGRRRNHQRLFDSGFAARVDGKQLGLAQSVLHNSSAAVAISPTTFFLLQLSLFR
ncbi:hypothetical protein TIFTF001_015302 [Ficus carica]|uniref:Uncharacterized protein n=1 Tax=Ficus carica TaxID=3494 RepID=A0AA88D501_FICCA|nr:hypothetical protein TIFTF001_015302 [Ficus carica]